MTRTPLSIPEIGIIAGTRAALGAGLGLLLADRLSGQTRRAVGWTLLAVGVVSTIPILAQLISAQRKQSAASGNAYGSRSRPVEYVS